MKFLIIYTHPPNTKSFCYSLKNEIEGAFKKANIEYKTIDLYQEGFDPILNSRDFIALNEGMVLKDVQRYQNLIDEYQNIIFITPLWWLNFPSILKGWFDRVFSYGYAYSVDPNTKTPIGLLKQVKRVDMIITMGSRIEDYKQNGLYDALITSVNKGLFEFCGINNVNFYFYDNVLNQDRTKLQQWLVEVNNRYCKIS